MTPTGQQKRKIVRQLSKPNGLKQLFEQHDKAVERELQAFKKSKVRKRAIIAISLFVVGILTLIIFG